MRSKNVFYEYTPPYGRVRYYKLTSGDFIQQLGIVFLRVKGNEAICIDVNTKKQMTIPLVKRFLNDFLSGRQTRNYCYVLDVT